MKRWLYILAAVAVAAAAGAWWWWKRRKAAAPEVRSDRPASVTPPRPMVAGVPLINYGSNAVGKSVPSVVETVSDTDDGLFRGG